MAKLKNPVCFKMIDATEEMLMFSLTQMSDYLEPLLEGYEKLSDPEKCVLDCEGIAIATLNDLLTHLHKHKEIMQRLADSRAPFKELPQLQKNFVLVKDQKEKA